MILTVTPNPAIDMTYEVDSFDEGESLRVDMGTSRAGGKGMNVARILATARRDVHAITTTGGMSGREYAADLDESTVPHTLVPVAPPTRRSIAIVDRSSGSTTIMNERGGALSTNERHALEQAVTDRLSGCTCLVASGSLPPGLSDMFYADLIESAHAAGVPAVIDAVGASLLHSAAAGADLVKPNLAELRATTGVQEPALGARQLLDAGARAVLVSLGADGMLLVTASDPGRSVRARLPRALEGNPTGAGDAAVAAVASCIADGLEDPLAIIARATSWSAAAVLMPVAGEIADNYSELEQLLVLDDSPAPHIL